MKRQLIVWAVISLFAFALCLLVGCPSPIGQDSAVNSAGSLNRAVTPTIYTAGLCAASAQGGASYWQGTQRIDLSGQIARAVFVSSGTVYTAGTYYNAYHDQFQPCYWKGARRVDLPGNIEGYIHHDNANSIFVTGGLVYIAGAYYNGTSYRACIWIDDQQGYINRIDLPSYEYGNAYAQSIYVVGTTTYVAGFYSTSNGVVTARLWTSIGRGGSWVDLPSSSAQAQATGVCVAWGKVYIGGFSYKTGTADKACYWTWTGTSTGSTVTLTRTDLPGYNAEVKSIVVSRGRVYTAGFANNQACYWVNRRRTDLPNNGVSAQAVSISVCGGTVYTAGNYADSYLYHACYWNGTNQVSLPDGGYSSWAYGICVN